MSNPSPENPSTRKHTIALVGSPNTGKSSLFSALCGIHQKVGNYPGVTVDKRVGSTAAGSHALELVDLPGVYSLTPFSPDEQVTVDALNGKLDDDAPDLVLFVADATNLERHLPLYAQIQQLGRPVILVLTMADMMEKEGVSLNLDLLSEKLQTDVVMVSSFDKSDMNRLRDVIANQLSDPSEKQLKAMPDASSGVNQSGERFSWAQQIMNEVESHTPSGPRKSERVDGILLHRVFGPLFFIAAMYLTFKSVYSWAGPFMDLIEGSFAWLGSAVGSRLEGSPMLQSLIADGVINGVGSVVIFLPQIIILFIFIAIMEDSGYMSRVAFLMDKMLSWTGLNGRAFIPLLSGFACAVPAIMATRVMPDPKARLATILVTPLTSCSARLPVYVLLISTFIEPKFGVGWAAFAFFAMHAFGILLALPIAWFFNRGLFKTPPLPFVLEMPVYRAPRPMAVIQRALGAGRTFLVQAGTIIFACTVVIWALSYFPRSESVRTDLETQLSGQNQEQIDMQVDSAYLEQSYLGRMGKGLEPIFAPLGFDWKISIGIVSAFPAREVIISTLGIVYAVGEADEESPGLREAMKKETREDGSPVHTPLTAVVLMIFFALCSQCMSTLATVKRELKSWKWPLFLFTYMTVLAYVFSFAVYQFGLMMGWG